MKIKELITKDIHLAFGSLISLATPLDIKREAKTNNKKKIP